MARIKCKQQDRHNSGVDGNVLSFIELKGNERYALSDANCVLGVSTE